MHWSRQDFKGKIIGTVYFLMAVAIWLLLRGYHGLLGDAQLYAFQALARIHPQLASDLYLQNTSQDQFTVFSPAYAWFIELLGLEQAARLLTLIFTVWIAAAVWIATRTFTSREGAWMSVILLFIVDGGYGGSGVFHFAEEFLTARLPAEALIATSLAFHLRGFKVLAGLAATAALVIHPLIALPGIMVLVYLQISPRASFLCAASCALATLILGFAAGDNPWVSKMLPVMDSDWLNVVQERSQFLFLQLWSYRDWELNARPFFYLAFIWLATEDIRVRRVCLAATTVAASGLAVALIAGTVGPVALIVQGQAWRWVWIAAFLGALLLPVTLLQIWDDKKCGLLCAVLLTMGVTLPINGTACVSLAILVWLLRSGFSAQAVNMLRWTCAALLVAVAAWLSVKAWSLLSPAINKSASLNVAQLRNLFALKLPAVLATVVFWRLKDHVGIRSGAILSAGLLLLSISLLPAAFKQNRSLASPADISEFRDWGARVPPTSTVLITPSRDVGTFVWFTLQRPNYLALDQSAGVVFSRATALEVQRRSKVLLPIMDANWKIRTRLRTVAAGQRLGAGSRPLTSTNLRDICNDTQLGFVVSHEQLGLDGLVHQNAGAWRGWELYACDKIRVARTVK
jgi:hypothetical protein